jgi:hypothetical protein
VITHQRDFRFLCQFSKGVDGSVSYRILYANPQGEKVTFSFKSPWIDPRWCSVTLEPDTIRPHFRLEISEVSDPIYEIVWSIYTTLSKEDAPPGNMQEYESETDSSWTKELMRGAKSVYFSITNSTQSIFYRKKYDIPHGMWCHLPPDMLYPGKTAAFGARGFGRKFLSLLSDMQSIATSSNMLKW